MSEKRDEQKPLLSPKSDAKKVSTRSISGFFSAYKEKQQQLQKLRGILDPLFAAGTIPGNIKYKLMDDGSLKITKVTGISRGELELGESNLSTLEKVEYLKHYNDQGLDNTSLLPKAIVETRAAVVALNQLELGGTGHVSHNVKDLSMDIFEQLMDDEMYQIREKVIIPAEDVQRLLHRQPAARIEPEQPRGPGAGPE